MGMWMPMKHGFARKRKESTRNKTGAANTELTPEM